MYISIHLMFLLIEKKAVIWSLPSNFNTSHVSINQMLILWSAAAGGNFNTSHVSINRRRTRGVVTGADISIHLMFLLIDTYFNGYGLTYKFQYISCFY